MKKLLVLLGILLITSGVSVVTAQTIGSTKTEEFKADFEKKRDISAYMDYEGPKKYIQILKCGIGEEVYEMYPELKEKRVGLGVANIVLEYLDNLNRFEFTEDKTEIKNRMVQQFKASNAGISENKINGRGNIKLAHYFVEIEVYDYSVSEPIKFNQSTISISTKKALDVACANILDKLIKKGVFAK